MFKLRISTVLVLVFALLGSAAFAQTASERYYQAVRNDDRAALRVLVKEQGANLRDPRGQTPLMFAAAFGSLDAMKLLIANGADVKAENEFGATALHWSTGDVRKVRLLLEQGAEVNKASKLGRTPLLVAAATNGTLESVKLLLEKGADVNVADISGFTPLIVAASVDDAAVAKLLVEKGASVNAIAATGQNATALMGAAQNGNAELTRFLLEHKADVHAISADRSGNVKNGPVAFGTATALHFAMPSGNAAVVKLLLDAGATVDPRDVRGMTPLMFAVASDRPNVNVVRMLLAKGADASIHSNIEESAVDWARKFNNPTVLAALKREAVQGEIPARALAVAGVRTSTPQQAVERSLPLLQRAASSVFADGGCVACHAQPVSGMAAELAGARGWHVNDAVGKSLATESDRVVKSLTANMQALLQNREGGGNPDTQLYESMMMATAHAPSDQGTDSLVHYLAARQRPAGNWVGVGATRAPMQDGDFSRTAMGIRTLASYGMPGRKAELTERIGRAAGWLARQQPLSTEDRVMQLLGLKWANASTALRQTRTKELVALQRRDGGWAQTPYLASDAYATGQVLYTLREMGVSATDAAFRRAADFLLSTQKEDGSWFVKSRAMKIQPYFQSGFPYDHDQWISAAGTAWAVMGLSLTAEEPPAVASIR
jgi:ankyrin repeat protein/DNA-binding transcriptional ArsR family regulator